MSTDLKNTAVSPERSLSGQEQLKIDQVRSAISPVPEKLSRYCSDATIARYLEDQNWSVKKATKMLKESLKWRSEYKPEEIRWEDIKSEATSGKIYRSTSVDKKGRPVLVIRPSRQALLKSSTVADQIKYMVYCMENAILNMPPGQEQMIWVVDFWNFSLSNVSVMSAKETAHILQNYYPGRLGLAIMYNPPWVFEGFYKVVKPFLEPRTRDKVKFVYANDRSTMKIMEDIFDIDQLESIFGPRAAESFDIELYAQKMKEDDEKRRSLCTKENDASANPNDLTNISSLSEKNASTQEENKQMNGDNRSALSTAEDSKNLSRDVTISASAASLKDSGDVKA